MVRLSRVRRIAVCRLAREACPGRPHFVSGAFPTIAIVIVGHWVILFLDIPLAAHVGAKQKAPVPLEDEGQPAIVVPPPFAASGNARAAASYVA